MAAPPVPLSSQVVARRIASSILVYIGIIAKQGDYSKIKREFYLLLTLGFARISASRSARE
jgi:hypothetical protein